MNQNGKVTLSTRLSSAPEKNRTVPDIGLEICIYIKMSNLSNMHIWSTKKRSQIGHPKQVKNLNQFGIYMLSHILISNKLHLFRKGWRRKNPNAFWKSSSWFAQNNHHILQFIESLVPREKNTFRWFRKTGDTYTIRLQDTRKSLQKDKYLHSSYSVQIDGQCMFIAKNHCLPIGTR